MKTIGASFIAGAFVLLGLGFQSRFTWKISTLDILLWILSGFFFILGSSLASIDIIRTWTAPRQRKRDERLKVHFEDMKKVSDQIIPTLKVDRGMIYLPDSSLDRLPKFPPEFVAHFPKENNAWNTYYSEIKIHSNKCQKFMHKIRNSLESSGLKVIDSQTQPKSPCIYEMIFMPLFEWWRSRFENCGYIPIDFTKIDINASSPNVSNLYVSGWNSAAIGYADSESDRRKCIEIISSVAFNDEYEKEAVTLLVSANGLIESLYDLKSQLIDTIQNVDKYWPGIKDYKFKKLKQCPICEKKV